LKPVAPWYGKSLGVWPDEDEELAELASAGNFEAVQQRIIGSGHKS
jgi:hypothetical protein